jgi:hypothetical protein
MAQNENNRLKKVFFMELERGWGVSASTVKQIGNEKT